MHTENVNRMIWSANDGILVTESIISKFDKAAKRFCRYGLTFSPMAWLVHRLPAGNAFHRAAAFIAVGHIISSSVPSFFFQSAVMQQNRTSNGCGLGAFTTNGERNKSHGQVIF